MGEPTDPAAEPSSALIDLVGLFARLRRECPWKAAQTHRSLARYLLEESYETVEAIESGDDQALCDELGDVLLQVYLHAAIAAEQGRFDIEDVAAGLRAKMIRRNPHVFGASTAERLDAATVDERWQQIKASEVARTHPLDGVPEALPALMRAVALLERSERAGTGVAVDSASADLGDRLFALVAECRRAGADPEAALRATIRRLAG